MRIRSIKKLKRVLNKLIPRIYNIIEICINSGILVKIWLTQKATKLSKNTQSITFEPALEK